MNFQTFPTGLRFKITFDLLWMGVLFALVMGVLGGMPRPSALRAVRGHSLREL